MRLNVTKHQANNHAAAPWLVVVPRRLTVTGRRQYRYFRTRAEASTFAASIRDTVKRVGEQPLTLAPEQSTEARLATAILDGTGLSLVQAAQLLRQLIDNGLSLATMDITLKQGERGAPARACEGLSLSQPLKLRPLREVLTERNAVKNHQSPHTIVARKAIFSSLFAHNAALADTPISTITTAHITRAIDATTSSPSTWNTTLTHLKALFSWAHKKGYISADPAQSIEKKHVEEKEISALTPAQLRKLLLACRPPTADEIALPQSVPFATRHELGLDTAHLAPYIAMAAFAGIRPTELTRIRWRDINLEEGIISVRRRASKTGGTRHIDIHPTLLAWLAPLRPHERNQDDTIFPADSRLGRCLRGIRRRAGYSPDAPWAADALRHSYATYYLKAGGDLPRLQLNMGHRSTSLLYNRYTNMAGITRAMAEEWWSLTPAAMAATAPHP